MEDKFLEYSEGIPESSRLVRKVLSFLNTEGGTFIIGVKDDTREAAGKIFVQKDEENIVHILRDNIKPIPQIDVRIKKEPSGDIIEINIPEGTSPPYYRVRDSIPNGVYVRIGSTSRKASDEDLARLYRKKRNLGYDEETITYYSNNTPVSYKILNNAKTKRYLDMLFDSKGLKLKTVAKNHLLQIAAAKEINDKMYPTIGGILMLY